MGVLKRVGFGVLLGVLLIQQAQAECAVTGSMSKEAIADRLQPPGLASITAVGGVEVSAQPLVPESLGKKIYDSACSACHNAGVAGAPKKGNKAEWDPRLKKGIDILVKHVREGFNAMPPGGACPQCTMEDYKHAIEYMTGASF